MHYPSRVILIILLLCPFIVLLNSCATYKNVPYFQDVADTAKPMQLQTVPFKDPVIQPDDLMTITIQTLDTQATELFAMGNALSSAVGASTAGMVGNQVTKGYLVDKAGDVDVPIIGKVHLQGLTTSYARDTIKARVTALYKNPSVDVRFANFKITVMGEVERPAAYTIPNERITVLDALGMAGDMTIFGRRENVLLIRDSANSKQLVRLNLNSKNIISSPYFYLKQNDMIYVEPNKSKAASLDAVRNRNITLIASALSVLIVIATRIK